MSIAYFAEIGRLFGMKPAGCSGKAATLFNEVGGWSGARLRYSLTQFTVAFNCLLPISFRTWSLSTHGIASHIDFISVVQ